VIYAKVTLQYADLQADCTIESPNLDDLIRTVTEMLRVSATNMGAVDERQAGEEAALVRSRHRVYDAGSGGQRKRRLEPPAGL